MKHTNKLIAVSIISFLGMTTSVMACEHKTVTEHVNDWAVKEKNEIIEFQKANWAEGKEQMANNWTTIKSLFTNKAK
jgi:hypothetical protein|tara:strand:- start:1351 stop:1581 length:231 start_codon:yes stop_codon:yes gene_type:complete